MYFMYFYGTVIRVQQKHMFSNNTLHCIIIVKNIEYDTYCFYHTHTEVFNLRVEVTIPRTLATLILDYSVLFVLYECCKHCKYLELICFYLSVCPKQLFRSDFKLASRQIN